MDPNDPWAIPATPPHGDASDATTYEAVGRALSQWEYAEAQLAFLFARFVAGAHESPAAQRAYGSVVSFVGRLDLAQAAGEVYFALSPGPELEARWKVIAGAANRASPRRNDIAHGIVQPFRELPDFVTQGWALYPSNYNAKRRDLRWKPKYAYTSVEIDRFTNRFQNLLAAPLEALYLELFDRHTGQP